MAAFDLTAFTRTLIVESLFYDEEFGASGNLSLIDTDAGKERFLVFLSPEERQYVIEEATMWDSPEESEGIGYLMATDSVDLAMYPTADAIVDAVLALCEAHNLTPSLTLLFDEEEA